MKEKEEHPEGEEQKAKRTGTFGRGVVITLLNLLAMALVAAGLIALALHGLDRYTHHGEAVRVPDLAGLTPEEAVEQLRPLDLVPEIVDSIFTEGMAPGVILKTTPGAGSIIKKHRTLFVTINTTMVERVVMPSVYDSSRRRAEAALRSAGFSDITIRAVPGRYNDLALEVTDRATGQVIRPGTELPYNTPLILSVTSTTSLDSLYQAREDSLLALPEEGTMEEFDEEDLPDL